MKSIPLGVLHWRWPQPAPDERFKNVCTTRPPPCSERQVCHVPRPGDVTHLAVQGDTPLPHLVRDH